MSHSTGSQALGFSFSFGLFFAIKKELFNMLEKRKLQVKKWRKLRRWKNERYFSGEEAQT